MIKRISLGEFLLADSQKVKSVRKRRKATAATSLGRLMHTHTGGAVLFAFRLTHLSPHFLGFLVHSSW